MTICPSLRSWNINTTCCLSTVKLQINLINEHSKKVLLYILMFCPFFNFLLDLLLIRSFSIKSNLKILSKYIYVYKNYKMLCLFESCAKEVIEFLTFIWIATSSIFLQLHGFVKSHKPFSNFELESHEA